jgi:hypothetical protein
LSDERAPSPNNLRGQNDLPADAPEVDYQTFVEDTVGYRIYLDKMIEQHPELFPAEINEGYNFHGFVESGKLHLRTRRILLKSRGQAYQLRPDTVSYALHDRNQLKR